MAKDFYKIDGRARIILICLVLTLLVLAVFAQIRSHKFVDYDDNEYIIGNNAVLTGLSWQNVQWAFTTNQASNWHPLTWLSHMLDCQLYGIDPGWHHLTNLFLHIANTLLLFAVLRAMTGAIWQSAFVAALFALHPLHVESVAWASERKDVLSTFFWLLTMAAYVRYSQKMNTAPFLSRLCNNYYLLAVAFFALGLMAKPMLVTLPFVLLLLDYWPLERKISRHLLAEKIPFIILSAVSSVVTFLVQQRTGAVVAIDSLSLHRRIPNAILSYVEYIGKMFWPSNLAIFYPINAASFPFWQIAACALLLLGISIFVVYLGRNQKYLPVGWFWFVGTLVPVIGIVQVGSQAMADRYTYVPLIGLFIMVSFGGAELFGKLRYGIRISAVSAAVIIFALMVCADRQVSFWRNTITLFEHAAQVTEDNYLAYSTLSNALGQKGDYDAAIKNGLEALRIRPNYDKPCYNLGMAYYFKGDREKAIYYWTEALKNNPKYPDANYNLAAAFLAKNDTAGAIKYLQEELKLNPNHIGAKKLLSELNSANH